MHHFLAYLEDCFLVRIVWMESASERQRNGQSAQGVSGRPGADPGLRPNRPGQPGPMRWRTAVLLELERRGCEVTYVRTSEGYEVDFLARGATGETELIQVCADLSDPRHCDARMPGARRVRQAVSRAPASGC